MFCNLCSMTNMLFMMIFFFFLCKYTHYSCELKCFISIYIHQKYNVIEVICSWILVLGFHSKSRRVFFFNIISKYCFVFVYKLCLLLSVYFFSCVCRLVICAGNEKWIVRRNFRLHTLKCIKDMPLHKACSKKDRTFAINTLFYNILSTVPFRLVPCTGDTPFLTFLLFLECFVERTFCDGAQFSYHIFLNLRVFKKKTELFK